MKIVLIGAGQRGRTYADEAYSKDMAQVAAVVEPDDKRREDARISLNIPSNRCYKTCEELWAQGKIADAAIIASMDRDHYVQTMAALDLGYDILLEKPISPNPIECMEISKKAKEKGRIVVVCHVLRYTPFFSTIKDIIDSGKLGKIISIQHNENIGNFHFAHSFVRGNWRNSDETSPLIMQKSCHDMDILTWLTNSNADKIASFGELKYLRSENAPENSAMRCSECKLKGTCHYSAYKAYLPVRGSWPATVLTLDQSEEGIIKAIEEGPYGRCVFHCDNNVCDNQVTLIHFKNGVNVTFHLSAYTNRMCRTLKIMCEKGEIRGHDAENSIEIIPFASNEADPVRKEIIRTRIPVGGHGGGDVGLVKNFFEILRNRNSNSISSVERSIESHIMACAAEKSRLTGQIIDIDKYKSELSGDIK